MSQSHRNYVGTHKKIQSATSSTIRKSASEASKVKKNPKNQDLGLHVSINHRKISRRTKVNISRDSPHTDPGTVKGNSGSSASFDRVSRRPSPSLYRAAWPGWSWAICGPGRLSWPARRSSLPPRRSTAASQSRRCHRHRLPLLKVSFLFNCRASNQTDSNQ